MINKMMVYGGWSAVYEAEIVDMEAAKAKFIDPESIDDLEASGDLEFAIIADAMDKLFTKEEVDLMNIPDFAARIDPSIKVTSIKITFEPHGTEEYSE